MALNQTIIMNDYLAQLPNLIMKNLTDNLLNLGIYAVGMALYGIVVWHFYRHLAKRETIDVDPYSAPPRHPFFKAIADFFTFLVRSLVLFPLVSFIYFLVLGGFLLFLSKSNDVGSILLMSVSIIAAARITAYYSEDLSKDMAKLIPFGLLGVFVVDPTFFSLEATVNKFLSLPQYLHVVLQYLIAIVLLEFILRVWHHTAGRYRRDPADKGA